MQRTVFTITFYSDVWIGIERVSGDWRFVDGRLATYLNWGYSPSSSDTYVYLDSGLYYGDDSDYQERELACQKMACGKY